MKRKNKVQFERKLFTSGFRAENKYPIGLMPREDDDSWDRQKQVSVEITPYPVLGVLIILLFYFILPIVFPGSSYLLVSKLASSLFLGCVIFAFFLFLVNLSNLPDIVNRGLGKIKHTNGVATDTWENDNKNMIPWPLTLVGTMVLLYLYASNMMVITFRVVCTFLLVAALTSLITVNCLFHGTFE